ncbi:thiol:disulfide interchange protein DsbD [Paracoccus alcaliphilus]|uniref:Thiol:disulfide interchange protein DsbD n=1 Tax=Paracoccus alcaliphilus TaxID=34002 RepID=A0A1H8MH24_9RHOB|nr:protein-disulfide reductase DsbD [Paracoccus alcaliphilus]WCR18681.1 protein-disulfide reductase DsbD [Paracoccus alcaliphilus]SEO16609.1 thiol:disulfide interchange protein DsbD [Paracoccus alcaliphilus]
MFASLISALLLLAGFLTVAQAQPLQPEDAFALSVSQGEDGVLILNWRIAEGYYLYRSTFAAEAGGQSLPLSLPEGESYEDPYFGEGQIYREEVTARLENTGQPVTLHWQGCQQDGICYAPQSARLDGDGTVLADDAAASAPGWSPQAASSREAGEAVGTSSRLLLAQDQGLVQGLAARGGGALVIAGFFGFGLLLAFTPCVFPMLPIVAGMLAGQGGSLTARRGLALTGAYVLAMAAAFGLLGIAAAWSGANLQMVLQSPMAIGIIAAIFVLLALSMFGFYELQMPQALQNRLGRVAGKRGSLSGAMVLGFTSALIVGPCVTAPLAGALLYIAQTGDVMLGAAALFALGLGQGLPLLGIGIFGPAILPRSGGWMEGAKRAFGVIFLGFAIWLAGRVLPGPVTLALWAALLISAAVFLGALDRLDGAASRNRRLGAALGVLLLFTGLVQGFGAALGAHDPLRPLAPLAGSTATAPASEAQFAEVTTREGLDRALASAGGEPALLYVTADWCVTCRAIERGPLADPAVHAALADMAAIKLDVSTFDAEAQALMRDLAAAGPPTMIFLDAARAEAAGSRLVGDLDSAALLASIGKVSP